MKLTEFFGNSKPIEKTGKTQVYSSHHAGTMSRQIKALTPGQTIQGEIVSRNGSEVQIKLSDDLVLNARLDQNMNLEVGKNMSFEVKNNGRVLTLSPLFANVATDANALKALDMASLPINDSTLTMTKLMMDAGLSIDRNSLQQVYREINTFSDADISDIVDLHKLGMAVNEGNVSQIAAYKNLNHQLTNGMNQVLAALPDTIQGMLQTGNIREAAGLYQELLALVESELTEGITAEEGFLQDGVQNEEGQEAVAAGALQNGEEQTTVFPSGVQANNMALPDELLTDGQMQDAQTVDGQLQGVNEQPAGAQEEGTHILQGIFTEESASQTAELANTLMDNLSGGMTLGAEEQELLNQINLMSQGRLGVKEQFSLVSQLLTKAVNEGNTELLRGLLGGKELQQFLGRNLQQLWTITPDEVADSKQVSELYQRLDRQLKGLTRVLENAGQTTSTAYQAAANMSQNIDFLQQFNQMYTYVQLPLRLQQGEAHGDLYVYTNKKNLAQKDGQISALLHLDMEHLGPVDVYVVMQLEKVNTKFYVQDDGMLDFLEAHMDLLTERLKKRGYNCSMETQVRNSGENARSGIGPILEQENHTPLAHYAFDVRA